MAREEARKDFSPQFLILVLGSAPPQGETQAPKRFQALSGAEEESSEVRDQRTDVSFDSFFIARLRRMKARRAK